MEIYGQYYDLLRLFEYGGFPPTANYLFLGDVDRGRQSLETICLLLSYKIKYPENFFVLRGTMNVHRSIEFMGFMTSVKDDITSLGKIFTDCFNCLPVAAIVDEKIFWYGGLSPELHRTSERIMRPTDIPDNIYCAIYFGPTLIKRL